MVGRREQPGPGRNQPHTARELSPELVSTAPSQARGRGQERRVTPLGTCSTGADHGLLMFHFSFMPQTQGAHTLLQFHSHLSRGRFCLGLFKIVRKISQQDQESRKTSQLEVLYIPEQTPLNAVHSGEWGRPYSLSWKVHGRGTTDD